MFLSLEAEPMMGSLGWNTASFTEPLCPGSCQETAEDESTARGIGQTLRGRREDEGKVRGIEGKVWRLLHTHPHAPWACQFRQSYSIFLPHSSPCTAIRHSDSLPCIIFSSLTMAAHLCTVFSSFTMTAHHVQYSTVLSHSDSSPCTVFSAWWCPRCTPCGPALPAVTLCFPSGDSVRT